MAERATQRLNVIRNGSYTMQTVAVWWRARLSSRIGLCWTCAWLADGGLPNNVIQHFWSLLDGDFCRRNWIADFGLRYGVGVVNDKRVHVVIM